ncbi:hypothetical protein CsSME_00009889 [Camellia sinensis var. sinensis]
MNDPKYAYPYPAQGYYQGPPVMAPPQYTAPPPQRSQPGFLEGWHEWREFVVTGRPARRPPRRPGEALVYRSCHLVDCGYQPLCRTTDRMTG